ncbi:MAG: acetyltransferase [Hymenobacteraceae bacterium]|nr:acetyltransferase [Hymenobacteraceae bacterium]
MENPVMILGAKTAGTLALDAFVSNDVVVYCFLDDDAALRGQEVHAVSVMGATDDEQFLTLLGKQCEVFVATEDTATRRTLTKLLKDRYKLAPVNAIHRTATVSEYAWLGHGNLVGAGAVVGPGAHVSSHCQLGARAVIEPGAKLEDFVQLGAGALVGPGAILEEGAFVGAGAVIPGTVRIGKNARVGAGSVVVGDVPAKGTVFGNPAKAI